MPRSQRGELVVSRGVSDAVDGADDAGPELAAQGLDVGVDRAGPEPVAVAPDVGQELLPGEDDAGLVAEEGQDVELGRGEVDGLAVEGRPAGGRLEGHPAQPQGAPGGVGGGGRVGRAPDPAEDGVDPGHQLPGAERLGEVVVGADGQADEEVGLRVPGGQHEDGHRPVLLDPPADLEPVEAGQHEVEDHEVGPDLLDERDAGRAVGGHLDRRSPRCAAGRRRRRRWVPHPRSRRLWPHQEDTEPARGERSVTMRRFLGDPRAQSGRPTETVSSTARTSSSVVGEKSIVGLADGQEPVGHADADDLVGFGPQGPAGLRRPDGDGDHHRRRALAPEALEGGPHAGAGGQAVVDEDHGGTPQVGRGAGPGGRPVPGRPGLRLRPGSTASTSSAEIPSRSITGGLRTRCRRWRSPPWPVPPGRGRRACGRGTRRAARPGSGPPRRRRERRPGAGPAPAGDRGTAPERRPRRAASPSTCPAWRRSRNRVPCVLAPIGAPLRAAATSVAVPIGAVRCTTAALGTSPPHARTRLRLRPRPAAHRHGRGQRRRRRDPPPRRRPGVLGGPDDRQPRRRGVVVRAVRRGERPGRPHPGRPGRQHHGCGRSRRSGPTACTSTTGEAANGSPWPRRRPTPSGATSSTTSTARPSSGRWRPTWRCWPGRVPGRRRSLPPDHYRRLTTDLRANGKAVVADLCGEPLSGALEGGLTVLKVSHEELMADGHVTKARTRTSSSRPCSHLHAEGRRQRTHHPGRGAGPGPGRRRRRDDPPARSSRWSTTGAPATP